MLSLFELPAQKLFLKKLLAWYKKHGRHDMPWRKTKDPYAIFVSEFMLQQTTVATVGPYYDRFLKKFPRLASVAAADLNDVLALWSGLGYYARARNLWGAMKMVRSDFKGKIPSDPTTLEKLPGVGPYTAGAIAAFAYNKPAAVLDGNIIRLLMRLLAIEDDPKMKPVLVLLKKSVLDILAQATKMKSQGKYFGSRHVNLALMDAGSTVCLPQNPKCTECPVSEFCLAKLHGRQDQIPMKGETPERPTTRRLVAVIQQEDKWLVGQRPPEGLFGGLWEFPGLDSPSGVEPVPFLEEKIAEEAGFHVRVREAIPAFEHQLTHRIFVIRPFICDYLRLGKEGPLSRGSFYEKYKWIKLSQADKLGISSITKRILATLHNRQTTNE